MDKLGPEHQPRHQPAHTDAFVLPLTALDRASLPLAGGKAARLGQLIDAGFSVPPGFCVTTTAYAHIAAQAGLGVYIAELSTLPLDQTGRQAELAAALRAAILQTPIAREIALAITQAYQALSQDKPIAVAVRSSATAEDLPDASFAGQQETFLNIIEVEAVLDAVRRCWASLWTDRAVSYRAHHGIKPCYVRLAVVVQRMIDAEVAGVLFTANPLTGKRHQAVIDANPGLGEAVVSGATTPDHFVVNTPVGEIVERRLSDRRVVIRTASGGGTQRIEEPALAACLDDAQILALADLGTYVEGYLGWPQDIEWAIDRDGQHWLLQARPITTLFPLPLQAPTNDDVLRVYLSFTVQQGTYLPFTPMGISAIRVLASAMVMFLGLPPPQPIQGPGFVTKAASRIFLDVTGALSTSVGRAILSSMMAQAEVHAAAIFRQLTADPRLPLVKTSWRSLVLTAGRVLVRTRLPWRLFQAILWPNAARTRLLSLTHQLRISVVAPATSDAHTSLAAVERLLLDELPRLLSSAAPIMLGGMGTLALASRLLGDLASEEERQVSLRGLPHNPTTEMNLALWTLAQQVRTDPVASSLVEDSPPSQLAAAYQSGNLPSSLQRGLADFLALYGHRSIAELDVGVPRWSEDPTYLVSVLASYLELRDPDRAPDRQYRRATQEATAMLAELTRRAQRTSRVRGWLVHFLLTRARALGGMREMPRFAIALLLAQARTLLWPVGEALAQAGYLGQAGDVFFLDLAEARAALDGTDLRATVAERRTRFDQERGRRHVPLVLLSDGTEAAIASATKDATDGQLWGTPASPGVVTARARVIHEPAVAHLEAGEILVAPSTDPGWTPLFLTAGGLVMEMGGAMSHGAIVAREYGLPAVVAVAGATKQIDTGDWITVDGSVGTITLAQQPGPTDGGKRLLS